LTAKVVSTEIRGQPVKSSVRGISLQLLFFNFDFSET